MAKTIAQLRTEAQTIKNETTIGANTATRVGGFGEDIVDYLDTEIDNTFATGEAVDDVSVFDELSELDGKTDEQKHAMIPDGNVVEKIVGNGEYIRTPIDLTALNDAQVSTAPSKIWESKYKGKFLPVNSGEVYDIAANNQRSSIIIPLKTCAFKVDTSYANNIATGYSDRIIISAGTTLRFTVPSDCSILYVQTSLSTGDSIPTIGKVEQAQPSDNVPTAGSAKAVKSNGVLLESSQLGSIFVYGDYNSLYLNANMFWKTSTSTNGFRIYRVNGGDYLHIKANSTNSCVFAFLSALGTLTNNTQPMMTSARYSLAAGQEIDIIAPQGTMYLYMYRVSSGGNYLPDVIGIYKSVFDGNAPRVMTLFGRDVTVYKKEIFVNGGRIYRLALSRTRWGKANVADEAVIFAASVGGRQFARVMKEEEPKKCYFFMSDSDAMLSVSYRADQNAYLDISLCDVTDGYNRRAYDVAFEDDGTTMESMMVRLSPGDLIRYKSDATSGMAVLSCYSRGVRDNTYLVDSVVADSAGVVEGAYMPVHDVYVMMKSDTGTLPSFQVFNFGEDYDNLHSPSQLVFDTDNIVTLLSPTDEDSTTYDNYRINHAIVLPVGDKFIMLYQAYGTWASMVSTWLMAYSSDGLTWTRGIPEGITPPYHGTNIIFKAGTIVGEFEDEVVNEMSIVKVNDKDYPWRAFTMIRNNNPNTIVGECGYFFKSADLANWEVIRKITTTAHDTFTNMTPYGDKIKVWMRMWDYTKATTDQRMIGYMFIDIEGNVLVPPTGLFGNGLYNPAVTRVDDNKDLFIASRLYTSDNVHGDGVVETWMKDGDRVMYAPSMNADIIEQSGDNDGWVHGYALVGIGRIQYFIYAQSDAKHGDTVTKQEIRACPVRWVTYNSPNREGG